MCKYCEQRKTLTADISSEGAEITIIHDKEWGPCLYVEAYCQAGYDCGDGYFKIDYCPMCGRKL